ncbi:MAG: type transport system permease protein [Blastocatellia bacterium]|jgi:ABC-2 type transport system permease protein|nr:type transport system permease protein [Blastocatellia bacterium]
MAVLERSYKRFEGVLSPEWSRFLIIPRHAVRNVFRSKLFTAFFALSFIWPLVCAILIYLHHNIEALGILQIDIRNLLPIDASFFQNYVIAQGTIGFFLAMLVGPQQVSRDLTNNALPLFLCRPFTRSEYVVGKMSIVIILVSTVTWIPGLILFLLQSYLEGWSWFVNNIWIASAIFIGSLVWILLLALMSQAISAWVKWLIAARAALLGLFFIPTIFAAIVNEIFQTRWAHIFDLRALIGNVWAGLFGTFVRQGTERGEFRRNGIVTQIVFSEPPLWASWLVLFLICALCLWLLSRKVRAYEVVK